MHLVNEDSAQEGIDMRSSGSNGHQHRRSIRYDIVQICIGVAFAAFLFVCDRATEALNPAAPSSRAVLGADTITAGLHIVRLELDHLVAIVHHLVRLI